MKEPIRSRLKRYAIEGMIFIVIATVMANVISYLRKSDLAFERVPAFRALAVDGQVFDSGQRNGKPLLIHFWATWCPTCKLEAPNIAAVNESYEVITVAVNSGSDDEIRSYMRKKALDYAVISDDGQLAELFDVSVFPTTFIIGSNGEVRFSEVGYTSTIGLMFRMWLAE
jgi:thiol-disulfide isomerase/thioredoxin